MSSVWAHEDISEKGRASTRILAEIGSARRRLTLAQMAFGAVKRASVIQSHANVKMALLGQTGCSSARAPSDTRMGRG
jgi:hypothetical protein